LRAVTEFSPAPKWDVRAPRAQRPIVAEAFHEWTSPDGAAWLSFFRIGGDYLLRFPGLADFVVSACGSNATAYPVPGVSAQAVEHLCLNEVLPLAMSRQWKLVLHASAVEIEDFAVAFIGNSGRGKSTLAASFSGSGHRFLTDDGLLVDTGDEAHVVQPSHPFIGLWEDSRKALIPGFTPSPPLADDAPKSRLAASKGLAFCDVARPLRCAYFLGEGRTDAVTIAPVSGRDAMVEITRHSFLLDIEEREMLAHHFRRIAELVDVPMFFRLDYPRRYEILPEVREKVIRHALGARAASRRPRPEERAR
jgi:hypothetical protein